MSIKKTEEVVVCGLDGKSYFGEAEFSWSDGDDSKRLTLTALEIELKNAWELLTIDRPMQNQRGAFGINRQVMIMPVGCAMGGITLRISPSSIYFPAEEGTMLDELQDLRKGAEQMATQDRMERANIVPGTMAPQKTPSLRDVLASKR